MRNTRYKRAKLPTLRKKKAEVPALFDEVLAGAPSSLVAARPDADPPPLVVASPAQAEVAPAEQLAPSVAEPDVAVPCEGSEGTSEDTGAQEEGPAHRRLIRATLPRTEGQQPRPAPQFTVRQPGGRPQGFHGGPGSPGPRAHSAQGASKRLPRHQAGSHAVPPARFGRSTDNRSDAPGFRPGSRSRQGQHTPHPARHVPAGQTRHGKKPSR